MGDIDCTYDRDNKLWFRSLRSPYGRKRRILFTIKGDVMEGTITVYPKTRSVEK